MATFDDEVNTALDDVMGEVDAENELDEHLEVEDSFEEDGGVENEDLATFNGDVNTALDDVMSEVDAENGVDEYLEVEDSFEEDGGVESIVNTELTDFENREDGSILFDEQSDEISDNVGNESEQFEEQEEDIDVLVNDGELIQDDGEGLGDVLAYTDDSVLDDNLSEDVSISNNVEQNVDEEFFIIQDESDIFYNDSESTSVADTIFNSSGVSKADDSKVFNDNVENLDKKEEKYDEILKEDNIDVNVLNENDDVEVKNEVLEEVKPVIAKWEENEKGNDVKSGVSKFLRINTTDLDKHFEKIKVASSNALKNVDKVDKHFDKIKEITNDVVKKAEEKALEIKRRVESKDIENSTNIERFKKITDKIKLFRKKI